MSKRTDIKSILILGAGPIVIGQACEFDYSGTQACKALREDGYRLIVVNSNPSTIMTDSDMADVTYIEPIQWKVISKIIQKERPDALLPTVGGQTALNCTLDLERQGILRQYHVELIGATADSITKAEDRQLFKHAMKKIGLETARSGIAQNVKEALLVLDIVGLPCIIRPSYTLGGEGGGVAYTKNEFESLCQSGFDVSPNHEVLIDEFLVGWKEYEMEVIRDRNDNCIIVCSIENIDPMGIHTGDSITVTPAQTLTDKEYQIMRNSAINVLREIGVETGGSNVQFAVNPNNGKFLVVEMNPRVSRSSALASKATGFPIAKVAAKLAVGYTLDELLNDIVGGYIPASFEPTIDYVVTKLPRFDFDKFYTINNRLTTQMKSVGEVMGIGCTQQESIQKALRALEVGATGFDSKVNLANLEEAIAIIRYELRYPGADRLWYIGDAFRIGMSLDEVFSLTYIDRWFLAQIQELIVLENDIKFRGVSSLTIDYLSLLKGKGFSDARLGILVGLSEREIRDLRHKYNLHPVYKQIDTCSAEFFTKSVCTYSTYSSESESNFSSYCDDRVMILGGGPNRIGQGIEFDYCCVHAVLALRQLGYETIMVNCNPETVSTDYDIADYLYFEPVTLEDVLEIIRITNPKGVIIQYGGQTPLKLSRLLESYGVNIIGTSADSIDCAENRDRFQQAIRFLGLKQPNNVTVESLEEAIQEANNIGYPLIIRPSYVLGGRAMEVVYNEQDLLYYFRNIVTFSHDSPVLLDQFLENAIEVDVDAVCDGQYVLIGGIMEHVEQAGIHSGDSACSLPTYTLSSNILDMIRSQVKLISFHFGVIGLINVQFAVKNNDVYLLEVNPRASRTIPFVSKATSLSLAKISACVIVGKSLQEQGIYEVIPNYFSVKEVILPFGKFPDINPVLGPEMRSTGEVMGIGNTFSEAFSKAILATYSHIKKNGCVLLSIDYYEDSQKLINLIIKLFHYGFSIDVIGRTSEILKKFGFYSNVINYVDVDSVYVQSRIKNGTYSYIIDTVSRYGKYRSHVNSLICQNALRYQIHYNTTLNASFATLLSLDSDPTANVTSIQEIHSQLFLS